MKRRKAVLTAALALLVALVAYGTAAYFSGEAHVTNVITTGNVDIELIETKEDGKTPWERVDRVLPGQPVAKWVWVKNTGSADAWIRVKVENEVKFTNGTTETNDAKLSPDYNLKAEGSDSPGWIEGKDGYYYYSKPLTPGESTGKLFETVTFSSEMDNAYQGCTVEVKVFAEAVQKKNNDAKESITELTKSTYTQIAGWPAE